MKTRALIPLIVATTLLGGVVVGYGLWYQIVRDESTRLATLTAEADAKGTATIHTVSSKSELRTLFEDKAAVAGYFLSSADIVSFLGQLESMGHALGTDVSIVSVGTDQTIASEAPQRLLISLKLSGSFDSVLRSIGAIEYGAYDVSVTSLTIESIPDDKKGLTWVATGVFSIGIHAPSSSASSSPETTTTP